MLLRSDWAPAACTRAKKPPVAGPGQGNSTVIPGLGLAARINFKDRQLLYRRGARHLSITDAT